MSSQFTRSRINSVRNAVRGLLHVIRTQKNAWIHSVATVGVILIAAWLQVAARDWAILMLTIAVVWMGEFLNTALEIVVDLASPEQHPLAKVGKDVGAAAVLIAAIAAAVIGFVILGPPLVAKFN